MRIAVSPAISESYNRVSFPLRSGRSRCVYADSLSHSRRARLGRCPKPHACCTDTARTARQAKTGLSVPGFSEQDQANIPAGRGIGDSGRHHGIHREIVKRYLACRDKVLTEEWSLPKTEEKGESSPCRPPPAKLDICCWHATPTFAGNNVTVGPILPTETCAR